MAYFKFLVKEENIAPSEVWKLDMPTIKVLLSEHIKEPMDLSIMLNAERRANGASSEFLSQGW